MGARDGRLEVGGFGGLLLLAGRLYGQYNDLDCGVRGGEETAEALLQGPFKLDNVVPVGRVVGVGGHLGHREINVVVVSGSVARLKLLLDTCNPLLTFPCFATQCSFRG